MEYLHSTDNVPWGTTKVPWVIIKITAIPPNVVLIGKKANVSGLLLVPPWAFTTILKS
jgi:hypothetical protein